MGKKLLIFITVMVGLALAGIIYVQVSYMKNAYAQNETLFDYKVNDALQSLVKNLDQMAIVEKIQVEMKKNKLKPKKEMIEFEHFNFPVDSFFEIRFNDTLINKLIVPEVHTGNHMNWTSGEEKIVVYSDGNVKRKNRMIVSTSSSSNKPNFKTNVFVYNGDTTIFSTGNSFDSHFKYRMDSNQVVTIKKEIAKRKERDVKKVMTKMVAETDKKLVREIKSLNYSIIDSLLKSSLVNHDIKLAYEYKVIPDSKKENKVPYTTGFEMESKYKKYEAKLFPNDIVPKKRQDIVVFSRKAKPFDKITFNTSAFFAFFSLIIIIAFTISIIMVIRQKKISDIKTDFINNMTHEFKTPIATISLAADTIVNPKVIDDKNKINQFIQIIKDENKRMNLQVERILQMALLERKELDLKPERLDIHNLIDKVISNIDIQIRQLNGKIRTDLNAIDSDVFVDEIHFINVINNLLDNALKYSEQEPEIIVSTSQLENGINLSVEDKGMGMSKEALSKIFEKFYRVSKGNIHNVKGFGLGLSYVKAIVEAHDGRISVKSELNKGSRFDIFIPQKLNGNGKST